MQHTSVKLCFTDRQVCGSTSIDRHPSSTQLIDSHAYTARISHRTTVQGRAREDAESALNPTESGRIDRLLQPPLRRDCMAPAKWQPPSHPVPPKQDATLTELAHDMKPFHLLGMRTIRLFHAVARRGTSDGRAAS